jgi:hypothetical protein
MMTGVSFTVWLALIACVIGGIRGGLLLGAALWPERHPGEDGPPPVAPSTEAKALGAAMLAAHAGSAAVLGYSAALGQGMALALGLGWIAAAAVRFWSARKLGQTASGAVLELLMGVVLALPAWAGLARLARGAVI